MKSRPHTPTRRGKNRLPVQRSREAVREYLLAEFDRPELKHGSRLPPIRDIAKHLRVSIRTVHLAIQQLAREGRVRTVHGSGTYLVQRRQGKPDHLTIAVGMVAPGSAADDPWHLGIYGGMMSAALRSSVPISFLPSRGGVPTDAEIGQSLLDQKQAADGLILFPFYRLTELAEQIRTAYEKEGKPVVTVNPPSETVTTNFVSADFLGASHRLGKAWKQTGRAGLVLLLCPSFKRSTSARLRWAGLLNAFGADLGVSIHCRKVWSAHRTKSNEETGYRTVREELEQGNRPQAVYCAGDFEALGALRAVNEAGLRVPEDVSIVGGSGVDLTGTICPQLTRMWQPLASIGEKLLEMLVQRMEPGPGVANAMNGIFLPTPFVGGATTRASENELLGISTRQSL